MFLPVRWKQDETLEDPNGIEKKSRAGAQPRGNMMEGALEQGDEEKELCLAFFLLSERRTFLQEIRRKNLPQDLHLLHKLFLTGKVKGPLPNS